MACNFAIIAVCKKYTFIREFAIEVIREKLKMYY
ncbi:MAG: DUF1819 family protein [Proteobacteria bacterium]|nr:DUF1819 family protein [Pseudomonadota bacterium]